MTFLLLAQAVADTAQQLADTANQVSQQLAPLPDQDLRFGDLLMKGGWIMLPIGIMAVLGLVIFFERYFTIRKAAKDESHLMQQVRTSMVSGNVESAIAISKNSNK